MKGELLQELRRDKGLSQKELGALLSVSPFTISSYECGHSDPDDEAKVKLAKFLTFLSIIFWGWCASRARTGATPRMCTAATSAPSSFRPVFRRRRCSLCASLLLLCNIRRRRSSAAIVPENSAACSRPRQVRKPAGGLFWSALAKCQPPAVRGGVKRLSLSVSSEAGWYSTPKRCSTQREGPRLREAGQVMQDTELFSAS